MSTKKATQLGLASVFALLLSVGHPQTDCLDFSQIEDFFRSATVADVTGCLDRGADVNASLEDGLTLLHAASGISDDFAVVAALIERGAEVDSRSDHGATPLLLAAKSNKSAAVLSTLIDAGADVNMHFNHGTTALHASATYNASEAVTAILLNAGADPNARADGIEDYPVLCAWSDG